MILRGCHSARAQESVEAMKHPTVPKDDTGSQLGQTVKTRQKLNWKIRVIDRSYFCLQQFDKF